MLAGQPRQRPVRAVRVEVRLPLAGEACALVPGEGHGGEALHRNRVGERRVESQRVRVEGIQQRRNVVECVPAVAQREHRGRAHHVGVVEDGHVHRTVVLAALRERRVGEEADRRFLRVLIEVDAAQRDPVVEVVIDLAAHLLAEIVRRALCDVVRTAVVQAGAAGVRQRQVLHDVRPDRIDAVRRNAVAGKRLARAGCRIGRQRIVNDDRTPARIGQPREVAGVLGRRRHVQVAVLRQPVAIPFGRGPEKRPRPDDRTADGAAGVAPELIGIRLTLQLEKEILADERARPHQQEPGALDPVRARFRRRVEHAAAGAPHLGVVGVHLHLHVFQRFDARARRGAVLDVGNGKAVEQIVVAHGNAAAEREPRGLGLILHPVHVRIAGVGDRWYCVADQIRHP